MGRRSETGGVTAHRAGIQLTLYYQGKRLRPTLNLPATEPNLRHARRMLDEIRQKIRHGTFAMGDYFPGYAGAESSSNQKTFGEYADLYESAQGKKAAATAEDYRKQLASVWRPSLGDRSIDQIKYSELQALIGELAVSAKTLNNYLIPLRGVFTLAMRDGAITRNPAEGIENAKLQRPKPDPFDQDEVRAIIKDLAKHGGPQIANYFAAAFYAGFRPSEQIALQWGDVDFKHRNVRVQRAVVRAKAKASTKTYASRDVELTGPAWAAFDGQRSHTQLAGLEVFWNPATSLPWNDIQMQWRWWGASLKRLGIRYRVPYQTRHTFATLALMAGNNPGWIATQMGNSPEIMFKTYAKWINGADKGLERAKMELALRRPA